MKYYEIEQCYGMNAINEVLDMAKRWNDKKALINYLKNIGCRFDAECLEMLIKYNFLNTKP